MYTATKARGQEHGGRVRRMLLVKRWLREGDPRSRQILENLETKHRIGAQTYITAFFFCDEKFEEGFKTWMLKSCYQNR